MRNVRGKDEDDSVEHLERERGMTEYQFHWWPSGTMPALAPAITLQADSHLHGAALALRHFMQLGFDITAPLAHVDMTEPNGVKQTLLVEEVLDWLNEPNQRDFIHREGLTMLLH
jgi:hypothetical protein